MSLRTQLKDKPLIILSLENSLKSLNRSPIKTLGFALVLIFGLGSLTLIGIGINGLLRTGALYNLGQIRSMTFIAIGGCGISLLGIGVITHNKAKKNIIDSHSSTFINSTEDLSISKLDLLNKLLKEEVDEKCRETIKKISELIKNNYIQFNRVYDHHSLHNYVTDISLKVRHDPKLKIIWEIFLKTIHKTHADCPVNKTVLLDFSKEFDYLNDPLRQVAEIEIEQLNKSASIEVLKEIADIEMESFGPYEAFTISRISNYLQESDVKIFVARDSQTKKIQGHIFYQREKDENEQWQFHIISIARKADAAKQGVARQLFQNFQKHIPSAHSVILEVRETNKEAIKLYNECGFKPVKKITGYYNNPKENAILMCA